MTSRQKLTLADKGAKKFLDDHFYTSQLSSDMAAETIEYITTKGIGAINDGPIAGSVYVEFKSGRRTTSICTFDELGAWAYETPFYAWLGWWLLFIGVGVETLIDVIEAIRRRRKSQTRNR